MKYFQNECLLLNGSNCEFRPNGSSNGTSNQYETSKAMPVNVSTEWSDFRPFVPGAAPAPPLVSALMDGFDNPIDDEDLAREIICID